ncbi:unnamed protein product [Linum trigynum]|uniref:BHLH domain-containing protein n=1 Tax=Linum trigynum TaxID=586398 RepID=A0AAV2CPR6_9ROSI
MKESKMMKSKATGRKKAKEIEVVSIRRNIRTLQQMIPGCEEEIEVETLFQKSIDHILKLKSRAQLLRDLLELCDK